MTNENNEKKIYLLAQDFGWYENAIWDASWHLFAGRPLLTYDTHIEFLYKKNKNKKNQAKRNFMSTLDI